MERPNFNINNCTEKERNLDDFIDYQDQQIKELREGLKELEDECDNQNPSHEVIWRLVNKLLNK